MLTLTWGNIQMTKFNKANQYIDDDDDELIFGKHKGYTFGQLIDGEPQYLNWCAENDVIEFSDECLGDIEHAMKKRGRR